MKTMKKILLISLLVPWATAMCMDSAPDVDAAAAANLSMANLTGADLRDANLRGAHLEKANFRFADLHGVNLEGALVKGADFQNATGLTNEQKKYLREFGAVNVPDDALDE